MRTSVPLMFIGETADDWRCRVSEAIKWLANYTWPGGNSNTLRVAEASFGMHIRNRVIIIGGALRSAL